MPSRLKQEGGSQELLRKTGSMRRGFFHVMGKEPEMWEARPLQRVTRREFCGRGEHRKAEGGVEKGKVKEDKREGIVECAAKNETILKN